MLLHNNLIMSFFSSNHHPVFSVPIKNTKVIIGLSGGVDSSVAAWLLKEAGYEVEALFMKNWDEDNNNEYCTYADDLRDVKQICSVLDIPLHTVNFANEYWENVFSYFLDEYKAGRTPNPDILCNKEIKFKSFLEYAKKLGADKIATGHYVQCIHEEKASLLKSKDLNKDQSYFLYALNQYQLNNSLFPIGSLEKPEVRAIAKKLNLVTHNKKDSTGICFIGERKFRAFLQEYLPAQPGEIQTPEGVCIGKHQGLMYYTLGQRQGLGIGGLKQSSDKPWYVAAKDLKKNILIAVQGHDHPWLLSQIMNIKSLTWVSEKTPSFPFKARAKIRYRHQEASCEIIEEDGEIFVHFDEPQWAATPGQSIVFYDNNICLGGGIISATQSSGGIWY